MNKMSAVAVRTASSAYRVTGQGGYGPEGEIKLGDKAVTPPQAAALRALLLPGTLANDAALAPEAPAKGKAAASDSKALVATDLEAGGVPPKPVQWAMTGDPTEGALLTLALKVRGMGK